MKNVIIFGAGASYGSDNEGITPPLGANLFNELTRFNPDGWGKIDSTTADKFRIDFEAAMADLARQLPHALPPLQRAMAAFFFNFKPQPTNLYRSIAKAFNKRKWEGAFISINYERLLELSLLGEGIQPCIGLPQPGDDKVIELCLPHGCCHIFCESAHGRASMVSFAGMNVSTNGPIKVIGAYPEYMQRIQNDAFPPVMSYFEPNKQTTSGKSFILGQRQRYSEMVASAERIVLIGIRVREHDEHIWEPLAQSGAQLLYVSGEASKAEYDAWEKKRRPKRSDVALSGYFRDEFSEILKWIGLS